MAPKGLTFLAVLICVSALSLSPSVAGEGQNNGLVMNFYKESCPQAEDIITEQVKLLYKRHKNTAFSWLRNIFHDCAVQVIKLGFCSVFARCMFVILFCQLIFYI